MISIGKIIVLANILVFVLFGIDKSLSKKKGKGRVPELVFHLFSFFFCAFGAALGMIVFNHKTSKMSFRIIVPLFLFVNYVLSLNSFSFLRQILTFLLQILPQ